MHHHDPVIKEHPAGVQRALSVSGQYALFLQRMGDLFCNCPDLRLTLP